jgi:hypothetical protein
VIGRQNSTPRNAGRRAWKVVRPEDGRRAVGTKPSLSGCTGGDDTAARKTFVHRAAWPSIELDAGRSKACRDPVRSI